MKRSSNTFKLRVCAFAVTVVVLSLAACANLSGDGNWGDVQKLVTGKTGAPLEQTNTPKLSAEQSVQVVAKLLAEPLSADAAVRIALLQSPKLKEALNTLAISDAQRVQAATLPNPHLALGRFVEGDKRELERVLSFSVLNLLTLPWQAKFEGQRHELAKLQAAQDVVLLAAEVRKTWVSAVAAQQQALYWVDAQDAAEAGTELARRMAQVGNFSRLRQAQEQTVVYDTALQLTRAKQLAVAEREKLIRLLGLWGSQTQFKLPERLPSLPSKLVEAGQVEAHALRERLDVRSALAASGYLAEQAGFDKATKWLGGLDLSAARSRSTDSHSIEVERRKGYELELTLPVFDWGGARNAKAAAQVQQSLDRVHGVAVKARSEAREAWYHWQSAHDIAQQYQLRMVPLRKFITDETLLRYNGMLIGTWDLLAETRQHMRTVSQAIDAQRDFWLADTDLHTALNGASPQGMGVLSGASTAEAAAQGKGH